MYFLESIHSANQIAGPRICRNVGKAVTNDSHIFTSVVFWAWTLALTEGLTLAQILTPAPIQTPATAPIISSTNKPCQQLMKTYVAQSNY